MKPLLSPSWQVLFLCLFTLPLLGLMICVFCFRFISDQSRRRKIGLVPSDSRSSRVVAFFHPHCSAGGGGERVLWKIVEVLGEMVEHGLSLEVIIYTIDPPSPTYSSELLKHVNKRFSLTVSPQLPLSFIHLHDDAFLLKPSNSFSLLVESLGTMRLAYRALYASLTSVQHVVPHLFVDTTGCAFTYVVANLLFGCQVLAYVHYPTISTDMLQLVFERRRSAYNHQDYIAKSRLTTYIKLTYYALFALAYGLVGSLATMVMVNSTWTYGHISSLWRWAAWRNRIRIVFPPCLVAPLIQKSSNQSTGPPALREPVILSIGQFRPEKDHVLQLEAMARLLELHPELRQQKVQLVLLGSCRGQSDQERLDQLQRLGEELGLTDALQFIVNEPYSVVQEWLQRASVGIHTMWNEHFGIGIVEMMAAGLIVVAHKSGGPKSDIVVPFEGQRTGFLATSADEYAQAMYKCLRMEAAEAEALRQSAQKSAMRFSDEVFADVFKEAFLQIKL